MKRKDKSQYSNSANKLKRTKQSSPPQEGLVQCKIWPGMAATVLNLFISCRACADSATQTVALGLTEVRNCILQSGPTMKPGCHTPNPMQVASFVGAAQLTVLSGTVWIAG